jgi:hypothetical protein
MLSKAVSLALCLTVAASAASAQQPAPDSDTAVLSRSVLEAIRANNAAQTRAATVMETFSNRLERLEAATRGVPPSLEGLRTDIIAIRSSLEKLATGAGQKRPAATLKFGPFACGNEGEASCAQNACRSVGYANGVAVVVNRTGAAPNVRPTSVAEATCYE